MSSVEQLANALRFLSIDAVEKAKSGHPGMPMGMATIAEVLWREYLCHNPSNPNWVNRDRFVLSNGHGSMLLYSLLHLSGYDVSIDELKNFRQLHSKTPGHPEYSDTPGVETTTGPLGQGFANAVGMAIAEKTLAAEFNRPEYNILNHHTYVFMGDGCLMEGVSHEAASLAGTLQLDKLVAFWDDNNISIDGEIQGWCRDDVPMRFKAYGWHVIEGIDGHDREAVKQAIAEARTQISKPTLICCRTTIGHGSPQKAGKASSHGAPLGADEIAATRAALGWSHAPFEIPADVAQQWDARGRGEQLEAAWQQNFDKYQSAHPDLALEFSRRLAGQLPEDWDSVAMSLIDETQSANAITATRKASQACLNALGEQLPELLGGSADLTGSNLTAHKNSKPISREDPRGNYIYYGVREFGMSAIMNGIALYGGFIPYGGTFLVFIDYARNALRMSALMKQRVIYVMTHDSIGLGEDGPTHQPIEHLNLCRVTPNVRTWRPADATETAVAWCNAIEHDSGPSVLALSRQNLEGQSRDAQTLEQIAKGGYVLLDTSNKPLDLILIATGSEVELAVAAAKQLAEQGRAVRVVSMPCAELFLEQSDEYQQQVLPVEQKKRIAIEAGSTAFWYRFVGFEGKVIGIDRFGESAPAAEVYKALGITSKAIVESALEIL